jgi:hypothetical protein
MAQTNSSTSIESLVGSLVPVHVDSVIHNLVAGAS